MADRDLWLLVVASALWGCTNPLMREGTKPSNDNSNAQQGYLSKIIGLITNWRFIVPFLLNQSGSIVYMKALGDNPLSVAVPVSTALTAFFTAITAYLLGEKPMNSNTALVQKFDQFGHTFFRESLRA